VKKHQNKTYNGLNNLIAKINKDNIKYFDYDKNKDYKNMKEYKSDVLKYLIYNNSNKIEFEKLRKFENLIEKIDDDL